MVDNDHTLSVHFFGKSGKKKVEDKIDKDISKGGEVEREKDYIIQIDQGIRL